MSITNVNIELLHWVILYVIYSQFMKSPSITVTSVKIELLTRVILQVTYTQYGVECGCNYFNFRPLYKSTKINSKYPCLFVKSVLNGKDLYIYILKIIF